MGQQLNPFQFIEQQSWSGMTMPYTLGSLAMRKPVEAFNTVTKVFAANNIPDRMAEMEKYPVMKVDEPDSEIVWDLIGTNYKNLELQEARMGTTTVLSSHTVGIGGARFKLVFTENYFGKGEIIVGEYQELYRIRVIDDPSFEGTNYVYDCELMGEAHASGIPGAQLLAGKRFSAELYAPTTLIRHDTKGTLGGSAPFKMKQEMSFVRGDYSVAGIELNRKLNVALPADDAGKKMVAMTIPYKDFIFEQRFRQGIGNALLFGRSNRDANGYYHDKDDNGEFIKTGAGIREQMQVANTFVYDEFSLKWVTDALYNMSAGKTNMGERRFRLRTGEKGSQQFHESALQIGTGWATTFSNFGGNANTNTIKNVQSNLHDNAFSIGFQIVEFRGPNGIVLTVEVDPTYDDVVRNKIYKDNNPSKGVAESYRYDITFEGKVDDGPFNNVTLVKVKGQEGGLRGYTNGPFGNLWTDSRVGNNNAATSKDEYACHKIMSFGVIVRDPTRTVTLLPQELAHTL